MNKYNDKYIGDPYSLAVQPRHVRFAFTNAVHLARVQRQHTRVSLERYDESNGVN